MSVFVDSHCHLNYKGLIEEQAAVLARAREAGVGTMLNISTREREWDDIIATAEREADVWATVGIHPHEADQHPDVDTAKLVAKARTTAWSASVRPGSIISTSIRIASGRKRAFVHISSHRARPGCR
jgi:Tat protein secretion system quality control protein TatD with DNase activity